MQKTFFAFALCLFCLFATLWLSKEELSENGVKTYAGGLSSLTDFFSVEREDCNLSFFDSSPFRFKAESVFVKGECDLKNIAKKYDRKRGQAFEHKLPRHIQAAPKAERQDQLQIGRSFL